MKKTLQKIKEGVLIGIGIVAVVGFTGLSYAAITWVTQSDVNPGDTLSASNWNEMVNNQNYLKQEVETSVVSKAGDTMAGELNMGTNKITELGTPTATSDATTKAYVDSVSASGGAFAFTVRGQTTCPSGYSVAYTGEAINFTQSSGGVGNTICYSGNLSMSNQLNIYAGWSDGTHDFGSSNYKFSVSVSLSCAVCYQ